MRKIFLSCVAGLSLLAAGGVMTTAHAVGANGANPLPIDYFAIRETVTNVSISPSGKYLALLRIASKEGNPYIEIYDTDDMSKAMRRLDANPMEFIQIQWVNDEYLFGTASKIVRKRVGGPEEDIRSYRAFSYNIEDNKFANLDGNFGFAGLLPNQPDEILIEQGRAVGNQLSDDPFAAFRPSAYFKFNLKKGTRSLVMKGSDKHPTATFDIEGNPVFTAGLDGNDIVNYFRKPGDSEWTEFKRVDAGTSENTLNGIQYIKAKKDDPSIAIVLANNGADKKGLWEFDLEKGEFGKLIYRRNDADIEGVVRHSMLWAGRDDIVAAVYPGAKFERHWFDMEEKALHDQLMASIPNAHQLSISSRSRDGNTMIVFNRAPRDPGSYYIIKDGQAALIGSQNPLLKPSDLADVEFIKYPARDGKMIPAYVTTPNTPGPHPLIVLPHGGPYITEVIVYDEWAQLLANNGYMVLQPQYRGSTGWGNDFFMASWDEHGGAMQDDKDDGAKYLVAQGKVDKDRLAMFGWSYGGYAALVAASRTPQLYQCVIAGAPVADAKKQYLGRQNTRFKFSDDLSRQRGGFSGINPINEVEKVNVPILFVHPEDDRRVMYYHKKDYEKAIKPHNKDIQFLTLENADHFFNTLYYNHQSEFYTKMLDYLANDCGPGGL